MSSQSVGTFLKEIAVISVMLTAYVVWLCVWSAAAGTRQLVSRDSRSAVERPNGSPKP